MNIFSVIEPITYKDPQEMCSCFFFLPKMGFCRNIPDVPMSWHLRDNAKNINLKRKHLGMKTHERGDEACTKGEGERVRETRLANIVKPQRALIKHYVASSISHHIAIFFPVFLIPPLSFFISYKYPHFFPLEK